MCGHTELEDSISGREFSDITGTKQLVLIDSPNRSIYARINTFTDVIDIKKFYEEG